MSNRTFRISPLLVLVIGLRTFAASPAHAATYTVDDTADGVDDNLADVLCHTDAGHCSLRAAIQNANKDAASDVVDVPPGVYILTVGGPNEDAAAEGDLDLTTDITIQGL